MPAETEPESPAAPTSQLPAAAIAQDAPSSGNGDAPMPADPLSPAAPTAQLPPGPHPTAARTPTHLATVATAVKAERSLARALGKGGLAQIADPGLTLDFVAPRSGTVAIRVTTRGSRTVLASASRRFKRAGRGRLTLKLTAAGKRQLRAAAVPRLVVDVTLRR